MNAPRLALPLYDCPTDDSMLGLAVSRVGRTIIQRQDEPTMVRRLTPGPVSRIGFDCPADVISIASEGIMVGRAIISGA